MRILVVEDEYLVARALAADIVARGHEVVGPLASASEALDLLDRSVVDGALLDIRLVGETSFPVADRLLSLGLPFCFVSAYEFAPLPDAHATAVRLVKPLNAATLDLALENFSLAALSVASQPPGVDSDG